MMKYVHLYVAFWRPDILAQFQATNARTIAVCDYAGFASDMTATLQATTCPACRETFLNAVLPTGDGTKLTWFQHVELEQAKEAAKRALAAAQAAKDAAQWTTYSEVAEIPEDAWTTLPTKSNDGWSTR